MLLLMEGLKGFGPLINEMRPIKALAESCSRQLRAWADSLQNSEITGQRHLTGKVRQRAEQKKRSEAFDRRLNDMLPDGHPAKRKK